MICVLVTALLLGQNIPHPQVKEKRVYFSSQFAESIITSIHGKLAWQTGVGKNKPSMAEQTGSGMEGNIFPFLLNRGYKSIGWCHPHQGELCCYTHPEPG